jgi:hypothetical protein
MISIGWCFPCQCLADDRIQTFVHAVFKYGILKDGILKVGKLVAKT